MDHSTPSYATEQSADPLSSLADEFSPEIMEPIRAGMRARAVADVCERSGLAAVLVDAGGRVLHSASRAQAMLGQTVDIVAGHLIGRTRDDNLALQHALTDALTVEDTDAMRSDAFTAPDYRVYGLPYRDTSAAQRLRGVLIFSAPHEAVDVFALRSLLAAV